MRDSWVWITNEEFMEFCEGFGEIELLKDLELYFFE